MSVMGVEGVSGFTPSFPFVQGVGSVTPAAPTQGTDSTASTEFSSLLTDGIDRLEGLQDKAATLAVQAATGDLSNIHDYTIAATESAVATQLTVAVRNKAIEAFNEIMRMQV